MSNVWLVQLVFDCQDPDRVARFWGQVLEYGNDLVYASDEEVAAFRREFPQFEGRGRIDDRELRRPPVYIQRVPEPKETRNRVRLEVAVPPGTRAQVMQQIERLGGGIDGSQLRDVENNEFTLIDRADVSERRLASVVFDCGDCQRMMEFWSQATGYSAGDGRCDPVATDLVYVGGAFTFRDERYLHVTGMDAQPVGRNLFDLTPGLAFEPSPEPKVGKNRIHLDLTSSDHNADRDRLIGLGATVLRWDTDHVMADPEGNEFCLSPSRSAR